MVVPIGGYWHAHWYSHNGNAPPGGASMGRECRKGQVPDARRGASVTPVASTPLHTPTDGVQATPQREAKRVWAAPAEGLDSALARAGRVPGRGPGQRPGEGRKGRRPTA